MRIIFVSSEVAPLSKSGGLGNVCGALPKALVDLGHEVVTVSPRYRTLGGAPPSETGQEVVFWLGGADHRVRYSHLRARDGLDHVLVGSPMFDREGGYYGDSQGAYADNLVRFGLLCRAALVASERLGIWGGHTPDVIHAHDWTAGLAPVYVNALYRPLGLFAKTRTVLTLHNVSFQGEFGADAFDGLDLSPRHRGVMTWNGGLSTLKGGIEAADVVTAVSPTFARELCTPEGGFGLDGILRRKFEQGRLIGILNGIDTAQRDPATHPDLPAHFNRDDLAGKAVCKAALQRELGLPARADAPLAVIISRFAWQKGLDLVVDACPRLIEQGLQLVIMGDGDDALERQVSALESRWPEQVRAWIGFNEPLSTRMYAAADLCFVPSRFEPCGLSQLYAMRYGAIPVVRDTGGLHDTVASWNPELHQGVGFVFGDPTPDALAASVSEAIRCWRQPRQFAALRDNAMARDSSWEQAARAYARIYQSTG